MILFSGCSLTYGDELENRIADRFSTKFYKQHVNIAQCGMSNDMIVTKTIEYIEQNPDVDYVKRYCISLLRINAKRDAILAATLQELAEAHVTIAKAEQAKIIHWWVLRRMIKNFFISVALFFVIRLNKLVSALNKRITKN